MARSRSEVGRLAPLAAPGQPASDAAPRSRLRCGVDVVDVTRFAQLLALRGSALCDHVFTPAELRTCRGDVRSLAARLAAKEAAAKALGTGIGPIAWRDVEVVGGTRGGPHLHLGGAARTTAHDQGLDTWAVSLTHGATHAIALVVATGVEGTGHVP